MTDGRCLTCHVLDVTRGVAAAGVGLRLSRLDGPSPDLLVAAATNADGRTDTPLLAGEDMAPGRYELAFAVGAYFARSVGAAEFAYLDVVPIHFGVSATMGHVHVALLVTPWSYTTYRGS